MIQSALPCAIFAGTEITINLKGGTNAENAPQIDYTTLVFHSCSSFLNSTRYLNQLPRNLELILTLKWRGGNTIITVTISHS
jgi:hypothetical protein